MHAQWNFVLKVAAPTMSVKTGPGTIVTWKAEGKELPEQGMSHSEAAWAAIHLGEEELASGPTWIERKSEPQAGQVSPPSSPPKRRGAAPDYQQGRSRPHHLGRGGTEGSGHSTKNLELRRTCAGAGGGAGARTHLSRRKPAPGVAPGSPGAEVTATLRGSPGPP